MGQLFLYQGSNYFVSIQDCDQSEFNAGDDQPGLHVARHQEAGVRVRRAQNDGQTGCLQNGPPDAPQTRLAEHAFFLVAGRQKCYRIFLSCYK